MKKLVLLSFVFVAVCAACKKGKGPDNPDPGNGNGGGGDTTAVVYYKGMGPSNEAPEGTPFTLPPGVAINKIQFTDTCFVANWKNRRGSGRGVQFCITVTNNNNHEIIFELPPYIIFISKKIKTQNGILLIPVEYYIGPKRTVTFFMEAYCLNFKRKASQEGDEYELGPVTQNAEIRKLGALLGGKEHLLETNGSESTWEGAQKIIRQTTVQKALWDITDWNGKLTDEHKQHVIAIQ